MADGNVTEALCGERMAHQKTILEQIAKDVQETRSGVGKLNRRLFEGNGAEALDIQVKQNTVHRERGDDQSDAKERFRWTKALTIAIAAIGWGVGAFFLLMNLAFG